MPPLPNETQRARLDHLLADVLVRIRHLAREQGAEEIEALADALHNVPREMHGWGRWAPDLTRGMIEDYAARYEQAGLLERYDEAFATSEHHEPVAELSEPDAAALLALGLELGKVADGVLGERYAELSEAVRPLARRLVGEMLGEVYFRVLAPIKDSRPHLLPKGLFDRAQS